MRQSLCQKPRRPQSIRISLGSAFPVPHDAGRGLTNDVSFIAAIFGSAFCADDRFLHGAGGKNIQDLERPPARSRWA
jgi:hypothetical protein